MIDLLDAMAIEIDDLPEYCGTIQYLLGLKNSQKSLEKNATSINREYGIEKWGVLLQNLYLLNNPTISEADNLLNDRKLIPFYAEGSLYLADSISVGNTYFNIIKNEIKDIILPYGHLVELGAGYGSIILKLATLPSFNTLRYSAGEFTDTGCACIKMLSSEVRNRIEVGACDLNDLNLQKFTIPHKAVFMTCWALAYIKGFPRTTLNEIIRHKPSMVIHIEPTLEHWSDGLLLHLLWQRYCQINDYNQSYLSALKEYEDEGLIQIVEERKNIFGCNPLTPVSVVKWTPCI
jgi:hypothetical protein